MTIQEEIDVLDHLEVIEEKTKEVLEKCFLGKTFSISEEEPFPISLMKEGAGIIVNAGVQNGITITGYHVVPSITEHLFLLNVQDKNGNTFADTMFSMDMSSSTVTVEEILVTIKPGAILYSREEIKDENLMEEVEDSEEVLV